MLFRKGLTHVGALSLVLSIVTGGQGFIANASTSPHGGAQALYAGNGVEVVTSRNPATGCAGVFLRSDATQWTNVTPPSPGKVNGQCLYAWVDAAFVSANVGWVEARNGGSDQTVLEHTTNGGATWTIEPGSSTGSNFGTELIGFASATDGWRQQIAEGSNKPYLLQHTSDAGASWRNVTHRDRHACALMPMVFATRAMGFEAAPLAGTTDGDNAVVSFVWRTLNGGATWTKFTPVSPPASVKQGRLLYGAPSFSGANGYLPVIILLPHSRNEKVELLTSHDFGATWEPVGNVVVRGALTFSPSNNGCEASSLIGGPLVSVGNANGSWWILRPGVKGATVVIRDEKGAAHESIVNGAKGLPSTLHGAILQPASARRALVTIGRPHQSSMLYATTDGGATWSLVTAATVKR